MTLTLHRVEALTLTAFTPQRHTNYIEMAFTLHRVEALTLTALTLQHVQQACASILLGLRNI